jgi:transketolase
VTALRDQAHELRRLILEQALAAGTCHIGSSLSVADLLAVLYLEVAEHPLGRLDGAAGDRILLSKGHAASALYAALAVAGGLDPDEIVAGYCTDGGRFAGHPERGIPGVEMSGGSLGHGPAIALGLALADSHDGDPRRTFCVIGDGELDEGAVWEAAALAGHLGLDGLTLVVDANGLQGLGDVDQIVRKEPLAARFESFGWECRDVDGHDHDALAAALARPSGRPLCVVARTVKGRGIDFMEDDFMWHYRSLKPHDRDRVLASLEAGRSR